MGKNRENEIRLWSNRDTQAELYQGLVDESSTAVVAVDKKDRRILFANDAWRRQEGIPRGTDVVGKRLEELIVTDRLFFSQDEIEALPYDTYLEVHKISSTECMINVHARSVIWDGREAYVCYSNDESELGENRQLLESALKAAKVITWRYDFKEEKFIWNKAWSIMDDIAEVYVDTPTDFIARGGIHEDCIEDFRNLLEEVKKGHTITKNLRIRMSNKIDFRWSEVTYTPIFDCRGKCHEAIGIAVDITERVERERRYRHQIEAISEIDDEYLAAKGWYNISQNNVQMYKKKSDTALDIDVSLSYDEVLQLQAKYAIGYVDQEKIPNILGRDKLTKDYVDGNTEGSIEFQRLVPGSNTAWIVIKYSLFMEPATGELMAFVYSYDMTERILDKKVLSKLSSMEYDGIGLLDVRTRQYELRTLMSKLEKPFIAGAGDYDERVKLRLSQSLAKENKEGTLELFYFDNIVKALEKNYVYDINYIVKDGNRVAYKKMQYSYLDSSRNTILYCRSDVTKEYLKEQEQLRIKDEALKRAEEANNAKTEFLSRMSHDIRTPMNTIVNLTKLVREEIDNKEQALRDLKKIQTSNEFLLSLVNDILDMSRIEQKNIVLTPERYSYKDFIDYIDSTFLPLAKEKNITFTVERGDKGFDIMIDILRFNQVCFNLISNAIKYTLPGGHICFKMVHGEVRDNKLPCDIYVIDDGIGMAEEFQKKMFEPFEQEGRTYKSIEGTGLGLSIVKEIVKLLHGTIDVESKEGKGSVFHVYFEMVLAEGERQSKKEVVRDYGKLQGKRILIAEDHLLNQEIAKRLLERVGIKVTIVDNGKEAVDKVKELPNTFDCILMDMRMPVMDGVQATREIRQLEQEREEKIPIIAMTANAFTEDYEDALTAGMTGYIPKPIEPDKMYMTIQKYLCDVDLSDVK